LRTTLNIEDELLARAAELTGIREKTSLVKLNLEALIARESAKRLAALGGTESCVCQVLQIGQAYRPLVFLRH
jgi:Arc/MetJ family transcription regulator